MAEAVSGLTGSIQGTLTGALDRGSAFIDRIFPPEKRNELSAKLSKFATEKPMFASFLLSHLALSGPPLALFALMTITVVLFSIIFALLIAVLAAVAFSVVAVGFALIILLPTVFLTTGAATFIWAWGVGAYYVLKWFNKKEIPGIHKPVGEGVQDELGLDALTGKGQMNGGVDGKEGEGNGTVPDPKKGAELGKVAAGKGTGELGKVGGGAKGVVGL
ncbi:MAG: hypothetical protein LQ351_003483 [Letrouitia transgressa]|nr:MAG: hypothetical protein LQ351_003483 [Letrouitia transgressa]